MVFVTLLIVIGIILLLSLFLFYLFYQFYFLRNPKRKIPTGNNIVSPADGRIVRIMKISAKSKNGVNTINNTHITIEKGIFGMIKTSIADVGEECYLIHIMLTPLDVHFQRAPIEGNIRLINYTEGKFQNAVNDAQSLRCFENEKNEILFIGENNLKVKVIQIAGALARRIVCFVKVGYTLKKGEHIGLIKIGSQVSLIIPSNCKLQVKENDYVYGGSTIIANILDSKKIKNKKKK